MSKTGVPSWISELNDEERVWATDYLAKRLPYDTMRGLRFEARKNPDFLTQSVLKLDATAEGVKLIIQMRASLRQKRRRALGKGRVSCSFTLPCSTKAKLKRMAKSAGTTETEILESLIEGAQQAKDVQKEEKRREALEKMITRNSNKLAQELNKIRLEATTRHLDACLKQLSSWQVYLNEQAPELSLEQQDEAIKLSEKRMREIREAIGAAVAKYEMMSPRLI
ncbi:hypothetical protein [Pseudomonas sp. NBRC 100443]|uniref:hypothetical protein n=1 Tax=Pseudomonas sp. NBRC 100443 TaxID=1113665 RepID=UPI0024A0EBFE|nr:hypothetical protein [Pseudomonas sp. NBRC 100443]GLU38081.1 hypothetical protein Pssp01_21740 [Pseudomonas sp. NBRC 100443]